MSNTGSVELDDIVCCINHRQNCHSFFLTIHLMMISSSKQRWERTSANMNLSWKLRKCHILWILEIYQRFSVRKPDREPGTAHLKCSQHSSKYINNVLASWWYPLSTILDHFFLISSFSFASESEIPWIWRWAIMKSSLSISNRTTMKFSVLQAILVDVISSLEPPCQVNTETKCKLRLPLNSWCTRNVRNKMDQHSGTATHLWYLQRLHTFRLPSVHFSEKSSSSFSIKSNRCKTYNNIERSSWFER